MRAVNGNKGHPSFFDDTLYFFLDPDFTGFGVDYTNVRGSDLVFGTQFDDTFTLSADAEDINGLGGDDTVNYRLSKAGVTIDLNSKLQHGGFAEGDSLTSIEKVIGSVHGDWLTGNASDNLLMGLGGSDRLDGGAGADVIEGGDGDDFLLGSFGSDTFVFRGPKAPSQLSPLAGDGHDIIHDFEVGVDHLALIGEFANLDIQHIGGDTVITYDGGSITLEGVDMLEFRGTFNAPVSDWPGLH